MAGPIYDPEGKHDDLDEKVTPEQNQAEVKDLESDFAAPPADDHQNNKSSSPEEIKQAETTPDGDDEEPSLSEVGGTERFFNRDKDKPRSFGFRTPVGQFTRRGKLAIGGGASILGLLIFGVSIFSFLNVFKLDFILKNIDAKTFSRYNAQFANRSNSYLKAYIRIRMEQFGDKATPDANGNMFFRANKVNTGNKIADFYATLRTSSFEKDLLEKDGISFTSVLTAEGKLRPGKITIKNESVGFDPQKELSANLYSKLESGNPAQLASALNSKELSDSVDSFVDKQFFNSDKEARKEIKKVVNDRTKFFQVIKRRRLRKNIQNMIGVRDWKFFEQTLAKYEEKKTNIQQKILSKLFPDNNELANLLECIFTGNNCNVNNDIAKAEATTESIPGSDTANTDQKDSNGKPVGENLGGSQEAKDLEGAIQDTAQADISKEKNTTLSQRIVKVLMEKFIGPEAANAATAEVNPGAWWKWAKRIAAIQNMVDNKTFSKMVKKARLAQSIAVFTMYETARDQMHTGQQSGQEVNKLMDTVSGFQNSEGWLETTGNTSSLKASAATTDPQPAKDKAEYCNGSHVKMRNEFAWACDDIKPNGGSVAGSLENAYKNTVGYITKPIADAVNAIKHIPIIGDVVDSISSFTDSIVGAISDATITPLLNATGATKSLGNILTLAMGKILAFAGVAPMFTGSEPGVANLQVIGSAGVAESSARAAGGVISTKSTLNYSNTVSANYERSQLGDQSNFERYASIDNPGSLAAKSLFAVSTTSLTSVANSFANVFNNVGSVFSNVFSGRIFAASSTTPASSIDEWAGVDTYDIPAQCQNLDPLDPNYVIDAVGVQPDAKFTGRANSILSKIRKKLTIDNERDETAFWKMVYDEIGSSPDSEAIAGSIYNCALLDRQVEGGMAYLYGYTDDGGLDSETGAAGTPSAPATGNVYMIGDSLTEGMKSAGLAQKLAAAGLPPTQIESTIGISVGSSIPKLQSDAANVSSAGTIIIELGTNNCSLSGHPSCASTADFQTQITNMVNAIRAKNSTAKIYWVNIYTTKGTVYQSINQALANLSGNLNYKVIDWAGEVTSNPGKYSFDTQLGVHLTSTSGYGNMAQFIIGALK